MTKKKAAATRETLATLIGTMDEELLKRLERMPEVKKAREKIAEAKQREEMETTLAPALELANKALSKKFKTFKKLAAWVLKDGSSGFSDEVKTKMEAMFNENKKNSEIAAALGLDATQVSNYKAKLKKAGKIKTNDE